MLAKASLAILLLLPALLQAQSTCQYVIMKEGVPASFGIVDELPDMEEKDIYLSYDRHYYGQRLFVQETLSVDIDTVRYQGRSYTGLWLKVSTGAERGTMIMDCFLSRSLPSIPEYALYYTDQVYYYYGRHDSIKYQTPFGYRQSHPKACGNFYGPKSLNGPPEDNPVPPEPIESWLSLEILDSNKLPPAVPNRYSIDTSPIQRRFTFQSPRRGTLNGFMLPLLGSKDSIRFEDFDNEWLMTCRYVGQIEALDQYIIVTQFEGDEYQFIERSTGHAQERVLGGPPLVSPDGGWVLSLYMHYYDEPSKAHLNLYSYGEDLAKEPNLYAIFSTWSLDERFKPYWCGERELVLRACAVGNTTMTNAERAQYPMHYQYLKLRIKEGFGR